MDNTITDDKAFTINIFILSNYYKLLPSITTEEINTYNTISFTQIGRIVLEKKNKDLATSYEKISKESIFIILLYYI